MNLAHPADTVERINIHSGLGNDELARMGANQHVSTMKKLLDHPNLMLDISWDVLYNAYRPMGEVFLKFFNSYPTRMLPGSDFVAAGTKDYAKYENELEITCRVLRPLTDEAFRNIAMDDNFFRLMGLDHTAPQLCKTQGRSVSAVTKAAAH